MDWIMPVNDMLEDEITKITSTMLPPKFSGDVRTVRAVQDSIAKIIDNLGEQSAAAQGLNKVITTADKLRNNPAHIIYLLKDFRGKEGKGEVIGMLKVGRKHLFLFDERDTVREVEPLCVLDFYVLRDRQRMGYGRKLYDYMLQDLEVMAWEMAIDGPSAKMEQFLSRNYAVDRLMRQNNNFAVAPNFFDRTDEDISNKMGRSPQGAAQAAAVGRFAAPKPASAIANVIHGAGHQEDAARRSPSPDESVAAREYRRYDVDVADWDDDWVEPEDKDDDDDEPDERGYERERYEPEPAPERPSTLGVRAGAAAGAGAGAGAPAGPGAGPPAAGCRRRRVGRRHSSGRRDSQLTDRGYFDVKYYHNRLW
ncbi:unnamed protein product [Chrysodeixis includens]|uniref:Alpha-tubulin N-acetyltransferase n=1 Tax=Chrysodeixis includens TaxID=689277 RepID=A0A9P0BKH4_CHRIL|nr:unnamed protein product [Chrysodeixis includens]